MLLTIACIIRTLPQHPGDTVAVSEEPVMLSFVYHLGLLSVLVPLSLYVMMVPVISAEWLFVNISMTLEVYGEVVYRKKR